MPSAALSRGAPADPCGRLRRALEFPICRSPRPECRLQAPPSARRGFPLACPASSERWASRARPHCARAPALRHARWPSRRIRPSSPAAAIRRSSMDRSPLPSPTNRQAKSTPDSERDRQASIRYAWPLTSCSVPTQRMLEAPSDRCSRVRRASLDPRVDDDDLLGRCGPHHGGQIPLYAEMVTTKAASATFRSMPVDVEIGSLRREAWGCR